MINMLLGFIIFATKYSICYSREAISRFTRFQSSRPTLGFDTYYRVQKIYKKILSTYDILHLYMPLYVSLATVIRLYTNSSNFELSALHKEYMIMDVGRKNFNE